MAAGLGTTVRSMITVDVSDLSSDQLTNLRALISDAIRSVVNPDDEQVVAGWTKSSLTTALGRLERENAYVQADAIRAALGNGGYVTRDRIYRIGGFAKERTLRGFTKPVNRIMDEMVADGEIPPDAKELLSASYQNGAVADGFKSPAELAQLLDGSDPDD